MSRLVTINCIRAILLGILVISFLGCAATRIGQFNRYLRNQNYAAALETMREEIANPALTKNSYLADIRIIGIRALYQYAHFHGLQLGMDEEAARYYKEGMKFAQSDEKRQAYLHHAFGNYYSWTSRNGLALPYFRKELEYWKRVNNTYHIIKTYDGFASCYRDMGQLELRDFYREKALELAKGYFVLGKRPSNANQWLEYKKFLKKRMDDICRRPNAADEILELWTIVEPITNKYLKHKFVSYLEVVDFLSIAGEFDRARQLYQQAEKIAKKEGHRFAHIDLTCKGIAIPFWSGDYERASREIDLCIDLLLSVDKDPMPHTYRTAGLSHEGIGDFDRAIDYFRESIKGYEKTRSSYLITERATFFRSSVRRSYWGLIRCLAKRGLATKDDADFFAALEASELVKGRQFGELMDERSGERVTLESLKELRNNLSSDEILLDYIFMDKTIVLFAFTKDTKAVFIMPYEREDFRGQVLAAAKGLATPASNIHSLQQQLTLISHKVLDPVRDMLKGKKRIIVLPDGILNAVPFDLLSLEQTRYSPIIEDKVVRVAPSIRYLVRTQKLARHRQATGLFALADPAYSRDPEIGGLSGTELRSVARDSKYLAYFTPLPETRTEVEGIAKMFKGAPVKTLYGANASESSLKRADLLPYSYLHMATHGILGGDVPGVSEPALVLAEEGGEDGFFTASEATELKLDAEIAVLSACKTGTGKYFTGEGVMGMSRSFLLAGSRSVLVSLWSVPSKETEQLMLGFYKYLRAGNDPSEAIRKAKLEMMRGHLPQGGRNVQDRGITVQKKEQIGGRQIHPFYWAAFIPFGA